VESLPMPEPTPPPPDPAEVAWSRATIFADKLFDALQDLDEAGGLGALAARAKWKPAKIDKASSSLKTVREAIEAQLGQLKAARRSGPGR
jgi:hypothetical protein